MQKSLDVPPVDSIMYVEGNTLIARDVFPDGELSCLKSQLGTYESPSHAQVVGGILSDPAALLLFTAGKLTQQNIEEAVQNLQKQKAGTTST